MFSSFIIRASLLCLLPGPSNPVEIRGHVVTESGEPVRLVQIKSLHQEANGKLEEVFGVTGLTGEFKIPDAGRLLFVSKPGFTSAFRILGPEENDVDLVLTRRSPDPPLHFSACTGSETGLNPGFGNRLHVPRDLIVQDEYGIDTHKYVVAFPRQKRETMTILAGMYGGSPKLEVLLQSSSITVRNIDGRGTEEFRGTLKTGKKWRWVSLTEVWLMYYDVSPEAADFFDSMIDRTCEMPLQPQTLR
jgi:hypothetical protein